MAQDTNVENLIINKLTKAQYESIANPDLTQLYFITDEVISSADVISALGYTPYSNTNPNNYTSNVGTVTSVNGEQPDSAGNVEITIPTVGNGTLIIQQNGTPIGIFRANQKGNNTIDIKADKVLTDGITISKNADDELQAIGVIDDNSGNALKYWTGTKAQYDAITTKDANTLYNITDDSDVTFALLELLFPVGAVYFGTMSVCPLQTLGVGTWQLKTSRFLVDKYVSGSDWWELYSDGWCRQGGIVTRSTQDATITLTKPYQDTNYIITALSTNNSGTAGSMTMIDGAGTKTTTGFLLITNFYGTVPTSNIQTMWQTEGYTSTVTQFNQWERIS